MKRIQNYLKKLSGGNSKNNRLLVKGINPFGKKARRSKTGTSTIQISKVDIKERFKHRLLFLCIIISFIGLSMYGLMGNQNAAAGSVACTPDSGFANCTRITYSGADQTFTVPANVTSIKVKMWGAGGAGVDANYYPNQSGGGAGGYTTGTIAVTPGQVLTVVVGQGGILGATGGGAYGGGGAGGSNALKAGSPTNARGSSGGGMSALFLPGGKTAANALLVSGGGGGASPGADTPRPGGNINGTAPFAGGGGGSTGGADTVNTAISGQGGTQSAGGASPTTTTGCIVGSTAGSQFQGGPGSSVAAIGTNGSEAGGNEGGGGGGGGWFGGGGGKCQGATSSNTTLSFQNSSGGGGSSYIGGTGVTSASTIAGGNGVYGTPGQGGTAANNTDTQYVSGIANGGTSSVAGGGTGGNGMVVIQYNVNTPDLTLAKSHTGSFTVGSTGTYSFTVNNIGTLATSGTITVTDTLPTGLTVNGGAAGGITEGGTNAANWTCNSNATNPQTITCTSSTAIAISGSSTFNFPVNVGVGTAVGTNSITNTASVSGGGQTNTANDSASDPTTVLSPNLTIAKTHTPTSFVRGSTGTYNVTVSNSTGTAATSGTITVTDTLPTGLTIPAGAVTESGANAADWTCTASGQTVTCTSSTAIAIGGTSTFGFNVNVAAGAAASVTNNVSVSGGNETTANNGNNSATDVTPTVAPPDLTIAKSHTGSFTRGSTGTYTLTVSNSGGSSTSGTITVTDTLPIGLRVNNGAAGAVTIGGTNSADWTCNSAAAANNASQTVTCTSSTSIAGASSSSFTLPVQVTSAAAAGTLTNNVSVSGGGESNTSNNTASDATTIVAGSPVTFSNYQCGSNANLRTLVDWSNTALPTSAGTGPYSFTTSTSGVTTTVSSTNSNIYRYPYGSIPSPFGTQYLAIDNTGATVTITLSQAIRLQTMLVDFDNTESVTIVGYNGATQVLPQVVPHASFSPAVTVQATNVLVQSTGAPLVNSLDTEAVATADVIFNSPVDKVVIFATSVVPNGVGILNFVSCAPQLNVNKTTTNGTGSFTFNSTANNGFGPVTLTTTAANTPVSSGYTYLTSGNTATTITETLPSNWSLTSASCVDGNNAALTSSLAGNVLTLPAASVKLDTAINCSFTNTPPPDLTIAKTHTGNFTRGSTGTYTMTVGNSGGAATTGTITVSDTLPTGLSVANGALTLGGTNSANWSCSAASNVITCTSSTAIAASGSSVFTFTVNVASNAPLSVTNTATVSGGGQTNTANDSSSDVTSIPQTSFGTCDSRMFLSQGPNNTTNTTLYNINTTSNPFTYPAIAQGSTVYNAIGFNPTDYYIYGVKALNGSANNLIRIGADGSTIDLGTISGLSARFYNNGEIGSNGVFYVRPSTANNNELFAIDISTRTATLITLSSNLDSVDLVWIGGMLYTVNSASGQLQSINPSTGVITNIGTPSPAVPGGYGAMFGAPNGLFGSANDGSGFYQFDLVTGQRTLISSSPGSIFNDGAHCVDANITFPADIAVTKTDGKTAYTAGSTNVYTITVTNNGPFGAQNVTVADPLPSGITTASWTCSATGGGTCAASGTGAINDATVDLPNGATVTYTMTMTVPAGFTGSLTNTATVTVGSSNTDPTPGNNSATDTDAPSADLTIAKSHTGDFTRGSTGTYTMTVNNIGAGSTSGTITVVDTLPTGLSVADGALTLGGTNAANWGCNATNNVITCTSSTAIAASGSSVFTFSVNVASNAPLSVTNTATVSGGGQTNTANDSSSDVTSIPQTSFGTCDSRMYLSQAPTNSTNTTLYNINTSANPLTFPAIAQGSTAYNAIGYNPTDNYIYGIQNVSNSGNSLIRIGADGSTVNLGVISGLPVGNYIAADIGSNGVYYVKSGSTTLYAINISTLTATSITLSPGINGGQDIAWVNGMLYTDVGSNGQLYSINPTTGATATIGAPVGSSYNFGALYGSPTALYGNDNNGTGFYQIDLTNGNVTKISDSPGAQTNDGAHCVNSPITFPADASIAKTDGQTNYSAGSSNVYTITVTNNGPFGIQNSTVSDPLPSGITTASWTCAATGGGTCAASGTGAINDATVDLPIGAVATYTLTMTVPAGFTGNLVNTATVTVSSSNTDPTSSNNSASDTDTAGLPNVGLVKSCPSPANCTTAAQNPGTDVTYNIAFTNSGGSGAQNVTITDPIPANTDFKLGTATTSLGTTGLTMVVEYSSDYNAGSPGSATWTYTPVSAGGGASAGYDRNVKAVRWRATAGILSNVSPNNTGSVSFVTKIR